MKLRHEGEKLLGNSFDAIWSKFKKYSEIKACDTYKCKKCESRYFCDICPAEMDLMFGDAQVRTLDLCLPAEIRRKFYCGESTLEEALKEASLNEENA